MEDPFFIEVDAGGCERCSHGKSWTVVGPEDVADSTSWEDEEEASDAAERLNRGYHAGVSAFRQRIERRLAMLKSIIPHDEKAKNTMFHRSNELQQLLDWMDGDDPERRCISNQGGRGRSPCVI